MLSKQQSSELTLYMCVCVYVCACVLQAVSEEQQPGLKGRKGKEEKSKGKAKVLAGIGRRRCWGSGIRKFHQTCCLPCQPHNKFAALDNEEEEDEEEITKEKEPPRQGKEKAKKAEQVYILVFGEAGVL